MADEMHHCPLCGKSFSESDVKCSGCLLSKNCHLLCCPNCGYSFREKSAVVDFFRQLFKKKG